MAGFPTGNESSAGDYSHCPPDVIKAIAQFDRRCKDGTIRFDNPDSIMPTSTPEDTRADSEVSAWAEPHLMMGDIEP